MARQKTVRITHIDDFNRVKRKLEELLRCGLSDAAAVSAAVAVLEEKLDGLLLPPAYIQAIVLRQQAALLRQFISDLQGLGYPIDISIRVDEKTGAITVLYGNQVLTKSITEAPVGVPLN